MVVMPASSNLLRGWVVTALAMVTIGLVNPSARAVEVDVDRPGRDYENFDLDDANYYICQRACQLDARCRAWTYVKPGYQGPKPRCWLKSAEPGLRTAPCCHSGVKDDFSSTGTIRQVQSILAKYGYDPGPIDGKPGGRTADAIKRFQAGRGLTVDGRITEPLKDALWKLWYASWWDERMAKDVQLPAPIAPQTQVPVAPSAKSTAPAEDLSDLDTLD